MTQTMIGENVWETFCRSAETPTLLNAEFHEARQTPWTSGKKAVQWSRKEGRSIAL